MTRTRVYLGTFLAASLVIAWVTAVLDPKPEPLVEDLRMSTDNAQPRGARGVYLWLRGIGYSVRSLRAPLSADEDWGDALFLLEPTEELGATDVDKVLEWVAGGGVLVVAPGYDPTLVDSLAARVTFEEDPTEADEVSGDRIVSDHGDAWRYREMAQGDRGMFAYPVGEIAFLGTRRVADPSGEHSVLFARHDRGVVAELFEGEGAILVFPEPDLLTNRGIAKADNVELLASLVHDWIPSGATIVFDDYDHGLRVSGSLATFLARRRPGLVALAIVVAGLLAVQRYGRSLTRRPDGGTARRRPTEFVEALGALYQRSRAVAPAWEALSRAGERVAHGTFPGGAARRVSPATLSTGRAAIEDARSRVDPTKPPTENDLLRLARAIASTMSSAGDGVRDDQEQGT